MGGLSPETRNRQVELFQSGEVDYIVATDAIGMGLNLDLGHVAFASLSKYDGRRQRRLYPAEMAQIAGRAGRHHKDGTFGTLSGQKAGGGAEFTEDEIYAIEEHKFAPLTQLFWRDAEPRFDSLPVLIGDLEAGPDLAELRPAPEAIDLAVLKRLAEDPAIAGGVTTPGQVRRLWELCQLPDFRQQGPDMHARFVARLWQDLSTGHLGADFAAARIAELDRPQGDIDTLQGRIAAIRSWAYICQRPDWVLARDEMAARARDAERRLSDALHQRLTERFVNRRTTVLMRTVGQDPSLLKVLLDGDGRVMVEGQAIGHLEGFRFVVDAQATSEERKLMLAAAERHLPHLLAQRADEMIVSAFGALTIEGGKVMRGGQVLAAIEPGALRSRPRLALAKELRSLAPAQRARLAEALELWFATQLAPLEPLAKIEAAARQEATGSEVRALLLTLADRGGVVAREQAGLAVIPKEKRQLLRRLGVKIGALDVFVPTLLRPAARELLYATRIDPRPLNAAMQAVIAGGKQVPAGYRRAGRQAIRVDMAEKLFRIAHEARARTGSRAFRLDPALATSMGLKDESWAALMRDAGFRRAPGRALPAGSLGPPAPPQWTWRAPRKDRDPERAPPRTGGVFAALADWGR
jgi:ATP-dependent RNA helicase SUPV3L1/SUV3